MQWLVNECGTHDADSADRQSVLCSNTCQCGILMCIPGKVCCMSTSAACTQDAFKRLIMAAACTQEKPLFYMQQRHDIDVKPRKLAKPHAIVRSLYAVVLMGTILIYAPGGPLTIL